MCQTEKLRTCESLQLSEKEKGIMAEFDNLSSLVNRTTDEDHNGTRW